MHAVYNMVRSSDLKVGRSMVTVRSVRSILSSQSQSGTQHPADGNECLMLGRAGAPRVLNLQRRASPTVRRAEWLSIARSIVHSTVTSTFLVHAWAQHSTLVEEVCRHASQAPRLPSLRMACVTTQDLSGGRVEYRSQGWMVSVVVAEIVLMGDRQHCIRTRPREA